VFTNSGGNVKFSRAELGGTEEKYVTGHSLVQLAEDFPFEIFSASSITSITIRLACKFSPVTINSEIMNMVLGPVVAQITKLVITNTAVRYIRPDNYIIRKRKTLELSMSTPWRHIAPLILNLDASWGVIFTLRPLYSRVNNHCTNRTSIGPVVPREGLDGYGEEELSGLTGVRNLESSTHSESLDAELPCATSASFIQIHFYICVSFTSLDVASNTGFFSAYVHYF